MVLVATRSASLGPGGTSDLNGTCGTTTAQVDLTSRRSSTAPPPTFLWSAIGMVLVATRSASPGPGRTSDSNGTCGTTTPPAGRTSPPSSTALPRQQERTELP